MATPTEVWAALGPSGRSTSSQFLLRYVIPAVGAWLLTAWLPGIGGVIVRLTILAFLGLGVVRRVHDTGRSTWFAISVPIGALLVMEFVAIGAMLLVGSEDPEAAGAQLAVTAVGVLVFATAAYLLFAKGTIGENEYGPDPRPEKT